jgi:hypothetical protein
MAGVAEDRIGSRKAKTMTQTVQTPATTAQSAPVPPPPAAPSTPPPPGPPSQPVRSGGHPAFSLGVADRNGKDIPPDSKGFSEPSQPEARLMVFHAHLDDGAPTQADMDLYHDIAKVHDALGVLYPDTDPANELKFRPYFVRLFYVAQLGLEGAVAKKDGKKVVGGRLSTDAAKAEVTAIVNDLIDQEAPRIKNGHLRDLARAAVKASLAFLVAYVALMLVHRETNGFIALLGLQVQPVAAANLMLLGIGSFLGVCLSYAIRTQSFSLSDLVRTDSDYLTPGMRLALTCALAMFLTLLCLVGLGDVQLGPIKLSDVASKPILALIVGVILGISEQKIPNKVDRRVGDLVGTAK